MPLINFTGAEFMALEQEAAGRGMTVQALATEKFPGASFAFPPGGGAPAANQPEIDWLFIELDRVQTEAEKTAHLTTPVIDCGGCGGKGSIPGGSLGDSCPDCDGTGVVAAPFAESGIPDFSAFRKELQAAETAQKVLGTPMPVLELKGRLEEMTAAAKKAAQDAVKKLGAPKDGQRELGGRRTKALPAKGGAHSDAELDELEDAAREEED